MSIVIDQKINFQKNQDKGSFICNNKSSAHIYNGNSPDFQKISPRIPINNYFLNRNYISSKNDSIYTIPLTNTTITQEDFPNESKRIQSPHKKSEIQFDFSISQLLKQRRLRNESLNKVSSQSIIDSKDEMRQSLKYSIDAPNLEVTSNKKKFPSQNDNNKIEITKYLTYLTSVDAETEEEEFRKRLNHETISHFTGNQNNMSKSKKEESSIYDPTCLKLIATKSDKKKPIKHLKNMDNQIGKDSKIRSPKSRIGHILIRNRSFGKSKTQDFTCKELDDLTAQYRFFFENVAQFKCSQVNFQNILGDSELINSLFASKIKGRFKEPPTSMKLIDDIFEFNGSKRLLLRQKEPILNFKNKFSLIDSRSLEMLRRFCYKLEEVNLEWKMNGIKNLADRLFNQQESQKITEQKILPKIFKSNKQRFSEILEICGSQNSQILPTINYDIRNKLANTERIINCKIDRIEKTNRTVNKALDKIYEKYQLNYYKSNTARTITFNDQ